MATRGGVRRSPGIRKASPLLHWLQPSKVRQLPTSFLLVGSVFSILEKQTLLLLLFGYRLTPKLDGISRGKVSVPPKVVVITIQPMIVE